VEVPDFESSKVQPQHESSIKKLCYWLRST
jgi:hypothetical protein